MTSSQMTSRCDLVLSFQRSGVELSAVDQNCARCFGDSRTSFCVKLTSSSNWRLSRSVAASASRFAVGSDLKVRRRCRSSERHESIGRRVEQRFQGSIGTWQSRAAATNHEFWHRPDPPCSELARSNSAFTESSGGVARLPVRGCPLAVTSFRPEGH